MSGEKVDFWEPFRFTKNSKMKSGTIAATFTFSALFLIIYSVAYYYLTGVLHILTATFPIWLANLTGALIPSLLVAIICAPPMLFLQQKKVVPLTYIWLFIDATKSYISLCIMLRTDQEALSIFLNVFSMIVPAPLVLGGGLAVFLYYRWHQVEND